MTDCPQSNFPAPCRAVFSKSFALFLLALWPLVGAFANHIIGGEMTYQYLGDTGPTTKLFGFKLTVYRDCDSGGGQLDNPGNIAIYRGSAAVADFVVDFQVDPTIEYVDPVIPGCADVTQLPTACVQRGDYVFTYELEVVPGESYFVVYQRCCRTSQIVNIQSPLDYGATYMVELTPEAVAGNNSSPTFTNYPPGFICNNFKLEFDHSATDADGDSLVYSFCTPLHGGGRSGGGGNNCDSPVPNPPCGPPFEEVKFIGAYNEAVPMGGSPTVKIDSVTGALTGRPNGNGQYVVGICVSEYRNGQLLGMVLRDFQFNVVDCVPAVVAKVKADAILGPSEFLVRSCGSKTVTVKNESPQNTAQLTYFWQFDLGNGNIFETSTWDATVTFPDYGEYSGVLYLNTGFECSDTGFITMRVFPPMSADFQFGFDSCAASPVEFQDLSTTGAIDGLKSWDWDFGTPGGTSTEQNPEFLYPVNGNYTVKLKTTDANDCFKEVSKLVQWNPTPPTAVPPAGPWRVCEPYPVEFQLFDPADLATSTVVWDFGDGQRSSEPNPTHTYDQPGTYTASVFIQNEYDCIATDTFRNKVFVLPTPSADFSYAPAEPSNLENTVQFTDQSDTSAVVWTWQFTETKGSHEPNPTFTYQDTGLVPVKLLVLNSSGCPDSLTKFIDIVPKMRLYIPNAIAPEGTDGRGNEQFKVVGILPSFSDFRMRIWNRWGELLFETNDPEQGWDGRRAGQKKRAQPGVYIYEIDLTGPRGEKFRREGTVSVF